MTFIETVSESRATGAVADMYQRDREAYGELPNFTRAFSPRPGVYAAWRQLNEAIKANMEPRRYELATLAAARRIGSSYCTLAHGAILIDKFLEPDMLRALVDDYRTADLDPADLAVIELAEKTAQDATSVTQADIDRLRDPRTERRRHPRRRTHSGSAMLLQQDTRRLGRPARREILRARTRSPRHTDRRTSDRHQLISSGSARCMDERTPARPRTVRQPDEPAAWSVSRSRRDRQPSTTRPSSAIGEPLGLVT